MSQAYTVRLVVPRAIPDDHTPVVKQGSEFTMQYDPSNLAQFKADVAERIESLPQLIFVVKVDPERNQVDVLDIKTYAKEYAESGAQGEMAEIAAMKMLSELKVDGGKTIPGPIAGGVAGLSYSMLKEMPIEPDMPNLGNFLMGDINSLTMEQKREFGLDSWVGNLPSGLLSAIGGSIAEKVVVERKEMETGEEVEKGEEREGRIDFSEFGAAATEGQMREEELGGFERTQARSDFNVRTERLNIIPFMKTDIVKWFSLAVAVESQYLEKKYDITHALGDSHFSDQLVGLLEGEHIKYRNPMGVALGYLLFVCKFSDVCYDEVKCITETDPEVRLSIEDCVRYAYFLKRAWGAKPVPAAPRIPGVCQKSRPTTKKKTVKKVQQAKAGQARPRETSTKYGYIYPGLKENNFMRNSDLFPRIPCCYKTAEKKEEKDKTESKGGALLRSHQLARNSVAIVPNDVSALLSYCRGSQDGDSFYRVGTGQAYLSASTFLAAVLFATNQTDAIASIEKTRDALLSESHRDALCVARQNNPDITVAEMVSIIRDPSRYLDPRRFAPMLEVIYKVNIVVLKAVDKTGADFVVPHFHHAYLRSEMVYDRTVVIFETRGKSKDQADTFKNPACEVVCWLHDPQGAASRGKGIVKKIALSTTFDGKLFAERILGRLRDAVAIRKGQTPVVPTYAPDYILKAGEVTQAVDFSGHARILSILGGKILFHIAPSAPLALPCAMHQFERTKFADLHEFMDLNDEMMYTKVYVHSHEDRKVLGVRVATQDRRFEADVFLKQAPAFDDTAVLPADLPRETGMSPFAASKSVGQATYNSRRRAALVVQALFLRDLANLLDQDKPDMDALQYLATSKCAISEYKDEDFDRLSPYLDLNEHLYDGIVTRGNLRLDSYRTRRSLVYAGRLLLLTRRDQVLRYKNMTVVPDFYLDRTDYALDPGAALFIGLGQMRNYYQTVLPTVLPLERVVRPVVPNVGGFTFRRSMYVQHPGIANGALIHLRIEPNPPTVLSSCYLYKSDSDVKVEGDQARANLLLVKTDGFDLRRLTQMVDGTFERETILAANEVDSSSVRNQVKDAVRHGRWRAQIFNGDVTYSDELIAKARKLGAISPEFAHFGEQTYFYRITVLRPY